MDETNYRNGNTNTGGLNASLNPANMNSGLNFLNIPLRNEKTHSNNNMAFSSKIDNTNYGQQTVLSLLNFSLEAKTSPNQTAKTSHASESYIPEIANSSMSSIHSSNNNIMSIAHQTIASNNNDMTNNYNSNMIIEYIPSQPTNMTMNIRNKKPSNPSISTTDENAIHFAFFLPSGKIQLNEKTMTKDILFKVHVQIYYQIDGPTNVKSVHETHKWLSDIEAVHDSLGFMK